MTIVQRAACSNPNRRHMLRRSVLGMGMLGAGASPLLAWADTDAQTHAVPWPVWQVQSKGRTVYLTGQTPPRATAWRDERLMALLGTCGTIWTETNHIHHQDPKRLAMQFGVHPHHVLSESLSPADQARFEQACQLAKIPLEALAPFRPWLAATQLESAYFAAMNLDEQGTAENVLLPLTKQTGIRHASEFPAQDDVLRFMGAMTPDEDLEFLRYTLDHILAGLTDNERVYSAWAAGDAGPATDFVESMRRDHPHVYARHVILRNQQWVARFNSMLQQKKPALVVVGLYHMVGPDGLPAVLERAGLRVSRG